MQREEEMRQSVQVEKRRSVHPAHRSAGYLICIKLEKEKQRRGAPESRAQPDGGFGKMSEAGMCSARSRLAKNAPTGSLHRRSFCIIYMLGVS